MISSTSLNVSILRAIFSCDFFLHEKCDTFSRRFSSVQQEFLHPKIWYLSTSWGVTETLKVSQLNWKGFLPWSLFNIEVIYGTEGLEGRPQWCLDMDATHRQLIKNKNKIQSRLREIIWLGFGQFLMCHIISFWWCRTKRNFVWCQINRKSLIRV